MKRKLPRSQGWVIRRGDSGVVWFLHSKKRPDLVAMRRDNTGMLDVVVAECKYYKETLLSEREIDQLVRYADDLPNDVNTYQLWLLICSDTEVSDEVREYAYQCKVEIKRLQR